MNNREHTPHPYGQAYLSPPDPVIAGKYGSWQLIYRVGSCGLAIGGSIRVVTDSDTDWGDPQFIDQHAEDHMTITTSRSSTLASVIEGGYLQRTITITIYQHPMKEDEEIVIHYGDQTQGGPGSRTQTFAEKKRYFKVFVDISGTGTYHEVLNSPFLQVKGGDVSRLSLLAPSITQVGQPFSVTIRALDRFGNPSNTYCGELTFNPMNHTHFQNRKCVLEAKNHGTQRIEGVTIHREGIYRLTLCDEMNGLSCVSNPIRCSNELSSSLFWGDMHGQVKQAEKLTEYFQFARDTSAINFASHQRNDHEISASDWLETIRVVKKFNEPGKFVVFLGYEWSGEPEVGGDHNIIFLDDDQPLRRSGHEMVEDKSDSETDLLHIHDVYTEFRDKNILIIPHVGGRPANLAFHDPQLEPVIEVHSTHGTFEWFLTEAIERGYHVGFIAGSDDYKLRLGGAYPGIGDRRFVRGGLTAVYAPQLTRNAIFNAIKARRCYGTTGARIILKTWVGHYRMGDEYTTSSPPKIGVTVCGTAPLDKVELFRGLQKIYEFPLQTDAQPSQWIQIMWEGASRKSSYSGVLWEGTLTIAPGIIVSPTFMPLDRGDEFYQINEQSINWHTFTCGDRDGLCFKTETEDAELNLHCRSIPLGSIKLGTNRRISAPLHQVDKTMLQTRVKDLTLEPMIIQIGPVDRRLILKRVPQNCNPRDVTFTFLDSHFQSGINAYWVRVTQLDGEMAWSSPIFLKKP
jgi:hypothetical protein